MTASSAGRELSIGILGEGAADLAATVRSVAESTDSDSELSISVLPGPDEGGDEGHNVVIDDADIHLAGGETGLLTLVRAGSTTPVLPVDAGSAVRSVAADDLGEAVEEVLAAEYETVAIDTVAVTVADEEYRALMDVMAVTTEAAKISEYQIESRVHDGPVTVDRVRADGVVASTPAGTPGYGTAAGGPILDAGLRAVSIVAVGPFRIEQPHWVLQLPISFRVVREEVPVSLTVDDRSVRTIDEATPVTLDWGEPMSVIRTSVSGSRMRADAESHPVGRQ